MRLTAPEEVEFGTDEDEREREPDPTALPDIRGDSLGLARWDGGRGRRVRWVRVGEEGGVAMSLSLFLTSEREKQGGRVWQDLCRCEQGVGS